MYHHITIHTRESDTSIVNIKCIVYCLIISRVNITTELENERSDMCATSQYIMCCDIFHLGTVSSHLFPKFKFQNFPVGDMP